MGGCVALVVAAGRGQRFGGEIPKQYRSLGGQSIIRRTLDVFLDHPGVDGVRVVIHPDDAPLYAEATKGQDVLEPSFGGATRQDSVRLGLESLTAMGPDLVLVHDAARPLVDPEIISRVLKALESSPAAIAALPVSDTLKSTTRELVTGTVDREGLWRAQTPQGFRYREILEAHRSLAGASLTDDAAVAEQAGLSVGIVMGSEENLKVTTEDDLRRAGHLFDRGDYRTGFGFDVHRFCTGDHVMLCGVSVPCDAGLEGHSDADVGLHALTDAILGAIGAGDIGSHFPPDDDRWRDAASEIFLGRAGDLVAARGGRIVNLDVTLICERPKIGPHRAAMVHQIAEILGLAPEVVNVKATTTERLGFTGRNEGIAAQAVASIRLPDIA